MTKTIGVLILLIIGPITALLFVSIVGHFVRRAHRKFTLARRMTGGALA